MKVMREIVEPKASNFTRIQQQIASIVLQRNERGRENLDSENE
jgi:hypothetical protein